MLLQEGRKKQIMPKRKMAIPKIGLIKKDNSKAIRKLSMPHKRIIRQQKSRIRSASK